MLLLDEKYNKTEPLNAVVSPGPSDGAAAARACALDAALWEREPDLRQAWQNLFDRRAASIFQHPQLVLNEADGADRRFGLAGRVVLHPECAAALLPVRIRLGKALNVPFPGRFDALHLMGGSLLGSNEPGAARPLLETLAADVESSAADLLLVEDVEQDAPFIEHLDFFRRRGWTVFRPKGVQPRLKIRLPANAEEYWQTFSAKARSNYRRKRKKIGAAHVVRVTRPEQVPELLEQAHEISRNTWQTQRLGLRIRNDEDDRRLFRFLAENGALRSYLLQVEGRSVAFAIGNQFHGCFNYEEVGFDRDAAHLSPGHVLLMEVLDDLFRENTPEWLDFGAGDAEYKREFANVVSASGTIWLVKPGWARWANLLGLRATRKCAQSARQALKGTELFGRLRKWHRFGRAAGAATPAGSTAANDAAEKE